MKKQNRVSQDQVAPEAPVAQPVMYTLNEKAVALAALGLQAGPTLQAPPGEKLGAAWRAPKYTASNTRAGALAAILAATQDGAISALGAQNALQDAKKDGLNLGTGTPRSYVKAFIANGYLSPRA